jgi:hypothetical protein
VGKEPRPKIPRDLFVIDEAVLDEYRYIEAEDTCYYVWERMSQLWRPGVELPDYTQYTVNGLISNLQIQPSLKNTQPRRYYWKERAIAYAAAALAALIPEVWYDGVTFVPIPPSKPASDPEYDGRLLTILKAVRPKLPDIRSVVVLDENCGFDSKQKGLSPAERAAHYSIDEDNADPAPDVVVLFDDVLTTGSHYKAIASVLQERFPAVAVFGLFLARAVRPPNDELFDFDL